MITRPNYTITPLMERISKCISKGHPRAFVIADRNNGNGPILVHQGHQVRVTTFFVDLKQGGQHIKLSHLSQPPYLITVAQEKPQQPLLIAIYGESPTPIFEHSNDDGLYGHVTAFSKSPDGDELTLVQALCVPHASHIFAPMSIKHSLLLEANPELCDHLLASAVIMNQGMNQTKERDTHGTQLV